jgi:hypothetical protein
MFRRPVSIGRLATPARAATAALALLAAAAQADALDERIAEGEPSLPRRLEILQSEYRCPITAYLTEIHRKTSAEQDRFLILWPAGRPELYVQCAFFDDDRQIHCEAVSGYYGEPIESLMTPARLAALAALGLSTDASAGNFVRERPVPDDEALYDVAGTLVETLVRVYDLKTIDVVLHQAPLAPALPRILTVGSRHCPALIGAR